MSDHIRLACNPETVMIDLTRILPTKTHGAGIKSTSKYKQIAATIREIGIIQPLIVHPHKGQEGVYILLDGHLRLSVLTAKGSCGACMVEMDLLE